MSYVEALDTPPVWENQQIKNVQPQIDLWPIVIQAMKSFRREQSGTLFADQKSDKYFNS